MNVAGITQKNIGYVARIIDEAVRAYPSNPINQGDLKKKGKRSNWKCSNFILLQNSITFG